MAGTLTSRTLVVTLRVPSVIPTAHVTRLLREVVVPGTAITAVELNAGEAMPVVGLDLPEGEVA